MEVNQRLRNLVRDSRIQGGITVLVGVLGGVLTIGQAHYLTQVIDHVFLDGQGLREVINLLIILIYIIAARGILSWIGEVSAKKIAVRIKQKLRIRLFEHIQKLGPTHSRQERTGELTSVAVSGIEALDGYFSQYLPQLVISTLVPLSILIFVFPLDTITGLVLLLTAPLIPVFMILIGKAAEALTQRQFKTLNQLSAHFLDSLQGLTTLKYFGRSKAHTRTIGEISDKFRVSTMNVLRVTFLSALVLELVATLSTAVVAVEVGLRLLHARMTFEQAFFVLILAPEFYLPLRMLGLRFHAGMNGTTAARKIFAILDLPMSGENEPRVQPQDSDPSPVRQSPIRISNLSYTYPDETTPTLQDINLVIKPGQTIAIVGASGAGKSTLANILLRFIPPTEGQISVGGQSLESIPIKTWRDSIAWVPQNPFIFNTTLADNIRFGQPDANIEAVAAAARAAHLHSFIESLPDGYETIVGESGSRLSSGQAQQVAIARAFLKDAPILILDEPTSNLDPRFETQLETSTRRLTKGRTVLIIAHRLNTVFLADQIVVLQKGKIVETGTHRELMANNGVYSQMVKVLNQAVPVDQEIHPIRPRNQPQAKTHTALEPQPGELPPQNIFFRLLSFLNGSWNKVALAVLIGAATIISNIGLIGTSSWLISMAALHPSIAELQVAIVGVRFFGISRGIFRYLERLISHDVTFRLLSRLRSWFYRTIEPLAPARLMSYRSGDLLSRVVSDIDTLENFYVRVISPSVVAIIVSLGTTLYVGAFDPRLGWTLLAFLIGSGIGLPLLILYVSRKPGRELVSNRADLHTLLVEGIQGLADLVAYGRSEDVRKTIAQIGEKVGRAQLKMALITGFHTGANVILTNLGMLAILTLGITAVTAGMIPGVMLAPLTLIALVSFEAVSPLPLAAQTIGETTKAAQRLFSVVSTGPEIEKDRIEIEEVPDPGIDSDFYPEIVFSNLRFTYPGNQEPALKDLTFKLSEGQSLAVVGPVGAGKSTLANLLMRFWDYQQGEIILSGKPLSAYSPDEARATIAIVPQQPFFFNASIRDNLLLARPDAAQGDIENAARNAKIHDFFHGLPGGYETNIYESGLRVSGGERQRLAIARAYLKDAPILILDEPTADLDPITESQILDTLFSLMGVRTEGGSLRSTLLITHRLVGLENVDKIIVLDNGRIVEMGSQVELLKNREGLYYQMYALQNRILIGV